MKLRWYLAAILALIVGVVWLDPLNIDAQGAPQVDHVLRIYTGGWSADVNGNGTCADDPRTTYVATEVPQGKFRHEANPRRLPAGRYDVTQIVWAVDHTGTEMTRWNYEQHFPSAPSRGELFQGDQLYTIAWGDSVRPAPGAPVVWFFELKVDRVGSGLIHHSTCSVEVVAP